MEWLVVSEEYLNYLRKNEKRIPNSDYGANKFKPFFGTLFETEDFYYVTQVSHAQERHQHMKNNIDFKKIYDPTDGRLLAVINMNYMFPIPKSEKVGLKYKDISLHRTFNSDDEKSKYINLMQKEIKAINGMDLEKSALFIYENKYTKKNVKLADRCIDFKQMEALAKKYGSKDKEDVETKTIVVSDISDEIEKQLKVPVVDTEKALEEAAATTEITNSLPDAEKLSDDEKTE